MFCKNCGKEISEDTQFCPRCGAATNQITMGGGKETDSVQPENLVSDLQNCLNWFSQIATTYEFYKTGNNLINNETWIKKVKSSFTIGLVFFIGGVVTFVLTMIPVIQSEWFALLFLWEILLGEAVFAIVGGIFAIIYGKHKSTLQFYRNKLPIIKQKIQEHYSNYEQCPLAIEYTDPNAISAFISYLNAGRAENLKEAVNLYEDECHKTQMITEMKQMKAAARQAASAATITAINTL